MRTSTRNVDGFVPFDLSIRVQSKAEFEALLNLFQLTISVPNVVCGKKQDACLTGDGLLLQLIMSDIYQALQDRKAAGPI